MNTNIVNLPFVSLCTPTYNRRPFIPFMIKCFEHQDYPKDRIEWIIIDDGSDPIEDLVKHIPQVKYFYYNERMLLGKKRNLMHSKCSGDIIVYMDDDDYYPPQRISHAVNMLQNNPSFLIAGCSEMHIYFDSKKALFQCGPYGKYHSTAATFAFKKQLLRQTTYDEEIGFSEEKKFTKNYTIPLIQLDPLKSILVCSHSHNSLNKEKLLVNPEQTLTKLSPYCVDDFIKDPVLKQFYIHDMNNLLVHYSEGDPNLKTELVKQIKEVEASRQKRMDDQKMLMSLIQISNNMDSNQELKQIKDNYEKQLADKNILINQLLMRVKELTKLVNELSGK